MGGFHGRYGRHIVGFGLQEVSFFSVQQCSCPIRLQESVKVLQGIGLFRTNYERYGHA